MAAHLRNLTPERSLADRLGAVMREKRLTRAMSQASLGRQVYASAALIRKVEHAERFPREDLIRRVDAVLQARGAIIALWNEANGERLMHRMTRRRIHIEQRQCDGAGGRRRS